MPMGNFDIPPNINHVKFKGTIYVGIGNRSMMRNFFDDLKFKGDIEVVEYSETKSWLESTFRFKLEGDPYIVRRALRQLDAYETN